MKQNIFRGLGVALITPFTESGEVDYNALGNLVEYQISNGADFLCILATTSESPCLSKQEKLDIQHFIVNLVDRRVPIVIGCGGNNTYAIAEELRNGDFNGIDGILSVCPYYNKPTQEGLYQHFKTLACATELPVILYNVPGRTGINMTAETTLRLANDCENIVAIKEASGNLEQIDDILKKKPEGFAVLSGDDSLTFPMLAGGAEGVISVIGNALPKEFSQMISMQQEGKYEEAVKIHHSLTELYKLLFVDGNPAGVKAVLTEMGYIKNVLRLPLVPARETTIQKISQSLQELKLQA